MSAVKSVGALHLDWEVHEQSACESSEAVGTVLAFHDLGWLQVISRVVSKEMVEKLRWEVSAICIERMSEKLVKQTCSL